MGIARRAARGKIKRKMTVFVRAKLVERYQKLLARMEAERHANESRTGPDPLDTADMAADALEEDTALRLAEMRSSEMLQIEDALRKLAEGTHGICESCGKRIPATRLQVLPAALLCVRCQRVEEQVTRHDASESMAFTLPDFDSNRMPERGVARTRSRL